MKKCPFCNVEMVKYQDIEEFICRVQTQKADLHYTYSDTAIKAKAHLCPKCGVVLHYLDEENLKYFQ